MPKTFLLLKLIDLQGGQLKSLLPSFIYMTFACISKIDKYAGAPGFADTCFTWENVITLLYIRVIFFRNPFPPSKSKFIVPYAKNQENCLLGYHESPLFFRQSNSFGLFFGRSCITKWRIQDRCTGPSTRGSGIPGSATVTQCPQMWHIQITYWSKFIRDGQRIKFCSLSLEMVTSTDECNIFEPNVKQLTTNVQPTIFPTRQQIIKTIHESNRRYMAEILPIRRKTLSNQSINQSRIQPSSCNRSSHTKDSKFKKWHENPSTFYF